MPWSLGTDIRSVPFTSLNRPHAINVLPTLDLCGPTALFCLRNHSHFFWLQAATLSCNYPAAAAKRGLARSLAT
jgi:hypothetical protein